jgi:hypothetical protein
LDLKYKENIILGKLTKEAIKLIPGDFGLTEKITTNLPLLGGLLINAGLGKQYLFQFKTNTIYHLESTEMEEAYYQGTHGSDKTNVFYLKDSLYYTLSADSSFKLYTTSLTIADFRNTGIKIYIPNTNELSGFWNNIILIFTAFVATIFVIWILKRYSFWNEISERAIQEFYATTDDSTSVFAPLEIELIRRILMNSRKEVGTTVEEVNFLLGLSKKTLEIQKKTRTEVINRINHAFREKYGVSRDLIIRKRSEEDRRYYLYSIDSEDWETFDKEW